MLNDFFVLYYNSLINPSHHVAISQEKKFPK